jgi:hypothetical protein
MTYEHWSPTNNDELHSQYLCLLDVLQIDLAHSTHNLTLRYVSVLNIFSYMIISIKLSNIHVCT